MGRNKVQNASWRSQNNFIHQLTILDTCSLMIHQTFKAIATIIEHLPVFVSYIRDLVPEHMISNPECTNGKQKCLSKQFLSSRLNRQGLERAKTSTMCILWKLIQLLKCRSAAFTNCTRLTPRLYLIYHYLSKIAYLFMCNFNKNFYDEVNSLWCILVHLH